jgi:hypothetical protein
MQTCMRWSRVWDKDEKGAAKKATPQRTEALNHSKKGMDHLL